MLASLLVLGTSAGTNEDTPGWDNGTGRGCQTYASEGWCAGGAVAHGHEWTAGAAYAFPEKNCVVCGKESAKVCHCVHGQAATGAACFHDGAQICSNTCWAGYHSVPLPANAGGFDCVVDYSCATGEFAGSFGAYSHHDGHGDDHLAHMFEHTHAEDRVCTAVSECAAIIQYESASPTETSDRMCAAPTPCTDAQYETAVPTSTSDRVCATKQCTCRGGTPATGAACAAHGALQCTGCDEQHHLIGTVCVGHADCAATEWERFVGGKMVCTALRVCKAVEEYQTVAPTELIDRLCAPSTPCTGDQYESAAPTTTGDRQCAIKQCACAGGSATVGEACAAHGTEVCATCRPGFHFRGTACVPHTDCAHGFRAFTDGSEAADRVCAECAPEHFSQSMNAASCSAWRNCEVGSGQSVAGSPTANRECTPCADGATFSAINDGDACAPVLECAMTEYETSSPTRSSDRRCATHSASCPDGQYTSAAPSTRADRVCRGVQVCIAGKYEAAAPGASSDRTCDACAPGTFKATAGSQVCQPWRACPVGEGMLQGGSVTADRQCTPCALGTSFSPASDGTPCRAIRPPCAAGEHTARVATQAADRVCSACAQGSFAAKGDAAVCVSWRGCGLGQGMLAEGSSIADRTCAACALGVTFSAVQTGSRCEAVHTCTSGEYQTVAPTTSSDRQCATHSVRCPDRQFTSVAPHGHADRVCTVTKTCTSGEYQTVAPTASSDRMCTSCPGGTFKAKPGNQACSEWRRCPAGQGMQPGSATKDVTCTACSAFHFKSVEGNAYCTPHSVCTAAEHETAAPSATLDRKCATKHCTCTHGVAVSGKDCPVHGAAMCSECMGSFHLALGNCDANVCDCLRGTRATGAACREHNAEICTACRDGNHFEGSVCVAHRDCVRGQRIIASGTQAANRECAACLSASFSDSENSPTCEPWHTCGVGLGESVAGSAVADRVCVACVQGATFSADNDGEPCRAVLQCAADEFETGVPNVAFDRACATHSTSCPGGQFTFAAPTGAADRVCHAVTTCVVGKYETAVPSASSDRVCTACAAGTFKDEFLTANYGKCVGWRLCPAGEGKSSEGSATSDRQCTPCVRGLAFSASTSADECQPVGAPCLPAFFMATSATVSSDRKCAPCPLGHFKGARGNEVCVPHTQCSDAQYETYAPSDTEDRVCATKHCNCNHGSAASGSGCPNHGERMCTSCSGAFHLSYDFERCEANTCSCANGGMATGAFCTTHAAELCVACNVGFHLANGACMAHTICHAGHYIHAEGTSETDRQCAPCASGDYNDAQNAATCQAWQTCPREHGLYTPGSPAKDRVCAPCSSGVTFSDENNGAPCKPVLTCEADEYETAAPTTGRDRTCATHSATCPSGQYTSTAPHSHADRVCSAIATCVAGTFESSPSSASSDRVCGEVAPGTFTSSSGMTASTAWGTCAAGFGQLTPGSATADRVCEACVASANFSPSRGVSECHPVRSACAATFYMSAAPTTSSDRVCTSCSPGHFKGAVGNGACAPWSTCSAGQGRVQNGSPAQDRICAVCDLGATFSPVDSSAACQEVGQACPPGTYRSVAPTVSSDRICEACAPSHFKSSIGNQACAAWSTCPAGSGQSAVGTATSDRTCTPCTPGKTFSADDDGTQCKSIRGPCPAGEFVRHAATTAADRVCAACAAGTFSGHANARQCSSWRTCPVGSGQLRTGTAAADRVCAQCKQTLTFSGAADADACRAVLQCAADEYEQVPPTKSSDRACSTHSASCPGGQFTFAAPTGAADRVCHGVTTCVVGKYETAVPSASSDRVCTACAEGTFKDADGDGSCVSWRSCRVGEGKSREGSATADRECTSCVRGLAFSASTGDDECQPISAPCPAAYFMDASPTTSSDRACAPCFAGWFKATPGNDICSAWRTCPVGHGQAQAGSPATDRVCSACTEGVTFSPAVSGAVCTAVAAPCAIGEYRSKPPTASSNRVCEACGAGQFKAHAGNGACVSWSICPVGEGMSKAGTASSDRRCALCMGATYSPTSDDAPCLDVSAPCEAGSFMVQAPDRFADRVCASCAHGLFKAMQGNGACTQWRTCPDGQGESASGTPTSDRRCAPCTLGATFSSDDSAEKCRPVSPACPVGTYRIAAPTRSSDRACAACAAGYYKSANGNEACTPWHTCPVGQGQSVGGTTTTDRVCTPCDSIAGASHPYAAGGAFSSSDSGDECTAVQICGTSEYQIAAPTASSDRVCATHSSACPEGQFTFKGPTAHADRVCHAVTTCVAGTFETAAFSASSNRECAPCPSGTFQSRENVESCAACAAGKHRNSRDASSTEAVACSACKPGSVTASAGATQCTHCSAGRYQLYDGRAACEDCAAGTYQHHAGQGECTSCAAGRYRSAAAASSAATVACVACEPGTHQHQEAQLQCTACTKGKHRNSSPASSSEASACTECSAGRYQDMRGELDCIDCAPGKHRTALVSSSSERDACAACPPGHFQDAPAQLQCVACGLGKYRLPAASAAGTEGAACAVCELGRYQDAAAQMHCHACATGKFRNGASNESAEHVACTACLAGHFQHAEAQLSCTACAGGKYRASTVSSSVEAVACAQCPHGRFQPTPAQMGRAACKACALGRFPTAQQTGCADHNTMEHVCHQRRNCEAVAAFKGTQVPAALNKHSIGNIDQWCDYECAYAPDRWLKAHCPHGEGGPARTGQLCQCHERRSATATDAQKPDQECNDHEVCSHMRCKKEDHKCPGHKSYKAWAAKFPSKRIPLNVCDDGRTHHSIRVFHHGHETTCKHGHLCFMRGAQCVCVQQTPSRPDVDRCWHDVHTETSQVACYRLCQAGGDAKACAAAAQFRDTKAPVISVCGGVVETVVAEDWHLCKARAMDEVDGDLTEAVRYSITRARSDGGADDLGADLPFYGATFRFHQLNRDRGTKLDSDFGHLVDGAYIVKMSVCDAAKNCATAEKAITVALPA